MKIHTYREKERNRKQFSYSYSIFSSVGSKTVKSDKDACYPGIWGQIGWLERFEFQGARKRLLNLSPFSLGLKKNECESYSLNLTMESGKHSQKWDAWGSLNPQRTRTFVKLLQIQGFTPGKYHKSHFCIAGAVMSESLGQDLWVLLPTLNLQVPTVICIVLFVM